MTQEINVGEKFDLTVKLDNNNDVDIPIKVWSYVYRGSKSYSGDREENKQEFILKAHSLHIIELENIVEDAEPGNYKFKVVLNKNNQKTNSQITKDIIINKKSNEKEANNNEKNNIGNLITANNVLMNNYGFVYESTT